MQSVGQRLADLLQLGSETVVRLLGIGTCQLEGHEHHGGLALYLSAVAIFHLSELHVGHVFQSQEAAVRLCLYDDVPELLHLLESASVAQRVLIHVVHAFAVAALGGLLAQFAHGGLQVLFGQAGGDV